MALFDEGATETKAEKAARRRREKAAAANGNGIGVKGWWKDAKSGNKIPSLRMRYKAANGYSREMEHWLTGSAVLQNKTETQDRLKSHYRTERGFEGFAANRYMLIKKS